jgi:arabinan endo-1,5-alpha-L-arabinosidase
MKNFIPLALVFVVLSGTINAQTTPPASSGQAVRQPRADTMIANNGLKGNLGVHDPVMIKAGDTYYVLATGMNMKTSKDMVNWKNAGSLWDRGTKFSWWNDDIPDKVGLWAPDIHYADGKYHLYYSVSAWMNFKSSIGYATNTTLDKTKPEYKWEDHGQVIGYKNGGEGVNCIDPNIFIDKDGKEWMIYGSYKAGLRLVQIDPKTGKPFSDKPELFTITTSLGEGSFIIKGPEYYYIFASRGRCCAGVESTYQMVMGRSKTVTGPYLNNEGESWKDNKYSLFLAGNYEEPGRGHNGFFAQGDTTYIVYHAYTRSQSGASLLNIKPLYMDDNGWPTIEPANNKLFKMPDFEKKVFAGK